MAVLDLYTAPPVFTGPDIAKNIILRSESHTVVVYFLDVSLNSNIYICILLLLGKAGS